MLDYRNFFLVFPYNDLLLSPLRLPVPPSGHRRQSGAATKVRGCGIERDGGINITNWKGNFIGLNGETYTPASLRTQYNIDGKYTMDANYDENTNPHNITTDENGKTFRLEWFNDVNTNNSKVGNNFWNKLGFSNDQINKEIVGSKIGTIDNNYTPLGTTQLKLDSADSILSSHTISKKSWSTQVSPCSPTNLLIGVSSSSL